MKFANIIKKTALVLVCPVFVFSSQWQLPEAVSAEGEDEIILSVESREIARNEIPSDRKIDLKVSIDKNPGFSEMYIIFENTSGNTVNLSSSGVYSGAVTSTLDTEKNIYYSVIKGSESVKSDSEIGIASVSLWLPESVNAGDVFEIKFISAYEIGDQNYTSGFMVGEKLTGFKEMKSGSIKIVEAKATEPPATEPPATQPPATQPPATEPPHTDPPQEPEHNDQNSNNENNNNENDQNNSSEETQAPEQTQPVEQTSAVPVTTAVSGTASLTASVSGSSVISAPQKTPASVTEKEEVTAASAVTTVKSDPGYGSENNDVAVNSDEYEFEPDRTIEYVLIAAIVVVAVAGFFTIFSILKRYKKK